MKMVTNGITKMQDFANEYQQIYTLNNFYFHKWREQIWSEKIMNGTHLLTAAASLPNFAKKSMIKKTKPISFRVEHDTSEQMSLVRSRNLRENLQHDGESFAVFVKLNTFREPESFNFLEFEKFGYFYEMFCCEEIQINNQPHLIRIQPFPFLQNSNFVTSSTHNTLTTEIDEILFDG